MAWFTRFDRFGDIDFVYEQEREDSCGPACVMMAVMKINKTSPGHPALFLESTIRGDYGTWQKKPYDGRAYGTYPEGLITILNSLHCGRWAQASPGATGTAGKIIEVVGTNSALSGPTLDCNPVIVGVNWDGTTASHWILIDTVRKLGDAT